MHSLRPRWLRPLGLRARLALALAVILTLALAASFVAVYRGTGTQVRGAIDQDLRQDIRVLAGGLGPQTASPQRLQAAARAYVARQPSFGSSARLYVIAVRGGATITNEPELLGLVSDRAAEHETVTTHRQETIQGKAVLGAIPGLHTFYLRDAGLVRVLVRPLEQRGQPVALVMVGESQDAVHRAQEGVAHTFVLAGALALLAALAAGFLVADRVSRRLRSIAGTASRVDSGELDHRIEATGPHDEVRVLADTVDHMLDRLQDAFDRQRAFVADASHELRTPLTVIAGQLEVLAGQTEVSRADVARVERAVQAEVARMQRLVEDLLLLAQADRHELIRPRPIDLESFLTETFESLALTAERDFRLERVPAGRLRADPDRLAQVVANLVRNAIEHTGPGGSVRLTALAREREVRILVDDDGVGIPPDELERVFDRFHRVDRARDRASGGTGLGLAIARAIVEAHGGRIWAERSPAGGARVAFELPGWIGAPRPPERRAAPSGTDGHAAGQAGVPAS